MKKRKFILWFCGCFVSALIFTTASSQELATHDLVRESNEDGNIVYLVGENDPHIVYLYPLPQKTVGKFIELEIELNSLKKSNMAKPVLELFWATPDSSFNSSNSIQLPVNLGRAVISIPIDRLADTVSAFRVDIDNCNCKMEIVNPKWFSYSKGDSPEFPLEFSNYLALKNGYDIPVADWGSRQLNSPSTGVFTFKNWDPRIINKKDLELPLNKAAGIFFDFDYNFSEKIQKFQLFWLLKGSTKWSPFRSAYFALIHSSNSSLKRKVFIPFDKLYSNNILQRLRFDFQACVSCRLKLNRARIVGWSEADLYRKYTPERIYYVHTDPPPKEVIAKEFFQKIKIDYGFHLFYLIVIIFTFFVSVFFYFKRPLHNSPKA